MTVPSYFSFPVSRLLWHYILTISNIQLRTICKPGAFFFPFLNQVAVEILCKLACPYVAEEGANAVEINVLNLETYTASVLHLVF